MLNLLIVSRCNFQVLFSCFVDVSGIYLYFSFFPMSRHRGGPEFTNYDWRRVLQRLQKSWRNVIPFVFIFYFFNSALGPDSGYSLLLNWNKGLTYFCTADDPQSDPNATEDPYKTLFVARLVRFIIHCHHRTFSNFTVCGTGNELESGMGNIQTSYLIE